MNDYALWHELGQQLRVDSVRATAEAGSGHPTSSMSAADLAAVLLAKYLRYDFDNPRNPHNDHLIFSKGHASPLLYSLFKAAGAISDKELLSFRKFGSKFGGHPSPTVPWIDVATGSLGQGLPVAVGMALTGKKLDQLPYRVWVLCGDGEMAEGSMWEAFQYAAFSGLDNLIAIIDVNRLGQSGETMVGWDLSAYGDRARAFGWNSLEIDGHDLGQIDSAYSNAIACEGKPTVIWARTLKGKGVAAVENKDGCHGKLIPDSSAAVEEMGGRRDIIIDVAPPKGEINHHSFQSNKDGFEAVYSVGDEVATRKAYGEALAAMGSVRSDIVALDGEVNNSTFAEIFAKVHPERYFEMYIAEQQMIACSVGMQVSGWVPFASSFAAFLSRGYDFIRMAAIGRANIRLVGSHSGVSIGEDGPSQMGLEDIALLRSISGSTVLYPSDANQTARLVTKMAERDGVVYMRTTREATPVLYQADEDFEIGGCRILESSQCDRVTIVAAGITLHEALAASRKLEDEGIKARVIDLYCVKPIDREALKSAADDTGLIITVEDHWAEGGLGDAVLDVFTGMRNGPVIVKLAVREMPTSGSPAELRSVAGIDAEHIVEAVRSLLKT